MKILAISHLFPHQGEKRYGVFVARRLMQMHRFGADVTVLVPKVWCPAFLRRFKRWEHYDNNVSLCEYPGLRTYTVSYLRPPGNWYNRWSGLVVFHRFRSLALQLHRCHSFDVIHSTCFFPDGDAAARLAKLLKIPAVCQGIGTDINYVACSGAGMHRYFSGIVKSLDGTLASGKGVAEEIKKAGGRDTLCVYGFVDFQKFFPAPDKNAIRKSLGLPADKIILLYAGYIHTAKGIFELIEAFEKIRTKRNDVVLAICGGGAQEDDIRNLVKEKHLEQHVIMPGNVDPDDMPKWTQAADVFVLPSYTEGMPNVVMEAMACSLPVVATAVGGLPDALKDCTGAILIEPKNTSALEDALSRLIADDRLRTQMGIIAREKALRDFGVEDNTARMMEYLESVIRSKAASKK